MVDPEPCFKKEGGDPQLWLGSLAHLQSPGVEQVAQLLLVLWGLKNVLGPWKPRQLQEKHLGRAPIRGRRSVRRQDAFLNLWANYIPKILRDLHPGRNPSVHLAAFCAGVTKTLRNANRPATQQAFKRGSIRISANPSKSILNPKTPSQHPPGGFSICTCALEPFWLQMAVGQKLVPKLEPS